MINQDELAICRRRGHAARLIRDDGWIQCEACGMWLREKRTIEEREDEPPEEELGAAVRSERHLAEIRRRLGEKAGPKNG
jgi:hypothetical protein